MTVVNLETLSTALGADVPADATVTVTYWAGSGPYVAVAGAQVVFPEPIRVILAAGQPLTPVDLTPTAGVCCVQWIVDGPGMTALTLYTSIPATGPVDFGALPVVDPTTYLPVSPMSTVAQTIQTEVDAYFTAHPVVDAALNTVGVAQAVFIPNGGTVPAGAAAYTLVIEAPA